MKKQKNSKVTDCIYWVITIIYIIVMVSCCVFPVDFNSQQIVGLIFVTFTVSLLTSVKLVEKYTDNDKSDKE